MSCHDDSLDKFKANTRTCFPSLMTYVAGLHRAWEQEPNHERITPSSCSFLQFTRGDLDHLGSINIDASADIVMAIFDITTDPKTWHLCTQAQGDGKGKESALGLLHAMDDGPATDPAPDPDPDAAAAAAAAAAKELECTATLAAELMARKHKDRTPVALVAAAIGSFAERVVAAGKEFHCFLVGCNTISTVRPIHAHISPEARTKVWVLCTNALWPGDLGTFVWHLYGSTVQPDLHTFRVATATMLQEYTPHFKRQRVIDTSSVEAGQAKKCLASMVCLGRLDSVHIEGDWTDAQVPLL